MSKIHRVDFRADEYVAGVSMLTFEEQGVYWMVCSLIASHGGPIEKDPEWISKRAVGMGKSKCRRIIERLIKIGKLSEIDHKLTQKRVEKELKNARNRSEKASENAEKRWENREKNPENINDFKEPPHAGAVLEIVRPSTANQQPTTNNQHFAGVRRGWESALIRAAGINPDMERTPASISRQWDALRALVDQAIKAGLSVAIVAEAIADKRDEMIAAGDKPRSFKFYQRTLERLVEAPGPPDDGSPEFSDSQREAFLWISRFRKPVHEWSHAWGDPPTPAQRQAAIAWDTGKFDSLPPGIAERMELPLPEPIHRRAATG